MKKTNKPLVERNERTGSVEYLLLFDSVPATEEDLLLAYAVVSSYRFARKFEPYVKRHPEIFPEVPPDGIRNNMLEKLAEDFKSAITELDADYLERLAKIVKTLKSRTGKLGETGTETFFTSQMAHAALKMKGNIDARKLNEKIQDGLSRADSEAIRLAINKRRLKPDRVRKRLGIDTPVKRGRPEKPKK